MIEIAVGAAITAILAVLGFVARSLLSKLSTHDSALAQSTRALAVLVARFEPLETTVGGHDKRVSELEQATAVLKQRVDDHIARHS